MAITQSQYDTFEAEAIAAYAARKGAKSLSFGDQGATFDSWSEVWAWLRTMKSLVSDSTTPRTRYGATSKGV